MIIHNRRHRKLSLCLQESHFTQDGSVDGRSQHEFSTFVSYLWWSLFLFLLLPSTVMRPSTNWRSKDEQSDTGNYRSVRVGVSQRLCSSNRIGYPVAARVSLSLLSGEIEPRPSLMFLVVCRMFLSIIDRSPIQMWNRFQTTSTIGDDHLCCFVRHNAISIRMSKCRENENNERQRLILSTDCFEREWPHGQTYAHLCVCVFSFAYHHRCYLIDSIMTFQQPALAETTRTKSKSFVARRLPARRQTRHWNLSPLFVIIGKCMALISIANSMYPRCLFKKDIETRTWKYQQIVIIIFNARRSCSPRESISFSYHTNAFLGKQYIEQSKCLLFLPFSSRGWYARVCVSEDHPHCFSNKDALHTLASRMYIDKRREKSGGEKKKKTRDKITAATRLDGMQTDMRLKRAREIIAHVRDERRTSLANLAARRLSPRSTQPIGKVLPCDFCALVEQLEGPLEHLILQSTRQE